MQKFNNITESTLCILIEIEVSILILNSVIGFVKFIK